MNMPEQRSTVEKNRGDRTRQHREAARNYDWLSKWYDFISGPAEENLRQKALHSLNIQPGDVVLEIGFGTGSSLPIIADRVGKEGKVCGIDISSGMCSQASQRLSATAQSHKIHLIQGDAVELPFAENSFSKLFLSFTIELFKEADILAILSQCQRVLLSGGTVGIVSLIHQKPPTTTERIYTQLHEWFPRILDCRPIHLNALIRQADFRIIDFTQLSMFGLPVGILIAS
jgi:demethylmenaquinone methyltransferase/2-methoxy-6-polyprenyl-1,4-benzoquinol methylase